MRIDLDDVQARSDTAIYHEGESNGYVLAQRWHASAADVPALVAELRAAREVVDAARISSHAAGVVRALGRYDMVVVSDG